MFWSCLIEARWEVDAFGQFYEDFFARQINVLTSEIDKIIFQETPNVDIDVITSTAR